MSLTTQDLNEIRHVVLDALNVAANPRLDSLEITVDKLKGGLHENNLRLTAVETRLIKVEGEVTALHNDVVELYGMAA